VGFEPGFSIPTRQRCVDFGVPDHLWRKAISDAYRNEILCLRCFISFADEKLLAWDLEIELRPVSLRTQMGIQQRVAEQDRLEVLVGENIGRETIGGKA
jgi:hypothetical protein